ncbi:MAG TPA: fibronectin type III domain-containing protein [Candidatus Saccharimonadales bacterium]|nr:fibronectin type III domain-containing protein [Candidatus Saccharimonadales bacterium]
MGIRQLAIQGRRVLIGVCALVFVGGVLPLWQARAAAPGSLYSYTLDGSSATIANNAASNNGVSLTLQGNWSQTSFGTRFEGDLSSKQSVGYAKPASGNTINVPTTQAFGGSVLFKYQKPASGNCFSDSPNITQIGKWGTNTTQFKFQLSNCGKSQTAVFPQCRVAGTSGANNPVTGTQALVDGQTYILQCIKSPDPASGNANLEMNLTKIDTVNGHTLQANSFSIAPTGPLTSVQYLSVANQYPLKSQTNNTDQFNGEIAKLAYCTGTNIAAAKSCLDAEVPAPPVNPPAAFTDEIHFAYGDSADEVVFNWRGTESTIYFGLDTTYGQQVTAGTSPITPWDIAGPFWEAHLTGLTPGATYHYKIGADGSDMTFRTKPTGDFTWVDIGDTKSTYCAPWMTAQHALIAAQNPHFVTHGGDIGLLNECGVPSTHAYYTDQEAWSHSAAFQPAWGNHEYGQPTADAPAGTPRDSLANYKGRSWITNAQTVPVDTATRISNPGCGEESGSSVNLCQGRDWGHFTAGKVLFISYPENWTNGWADWQAKAGNLMADAQADPNIDFIVTYGHRPPYTSSGEGPNLTIRSTLEALAATYSPTATNATGKYILNVAHHAHSQEAFAPIAGLTHIVDAAGGQGFTSFSDIDPNSVFRSMHFGILRGDYDAADGTLTVSLICGAEYTTVKDACTYGDTIYSTTFQRGSTPPQTDPAVLDTTLTNGVTQASIGDSLTYTVNVQNAPTNAETASNVSVNLTLPANLNITNAGGGTVNGNVVSWNVGNLAAGQSATHQIVATLQSGNSGDQYTAQAAVESADCNNAGSSCTANDTDTVFAQPSLIEWVTNQSVETDMTGWTGAYGGNSLVQISHERTLGRTGTSSIKVAGLTGASNKKSGINANPRWILSAQSGKTYTGSAWVKTQAAGQSVTILLREWNGNTLVSENSQTVTPTSTDWFKLEAPLTAGQNGTSIAFAVYGNDVDAGEYFYVDDFSLISTQ